MIKTDNGIMYMTGGEACYISRTDGGLAHLCFGARVEPEDDMRSAVGGGCREYGFELSRGGKAVKTAFSLKSCEVVTRRTECAFPTLRCGKTLEAVLDDEKNALELRLFYKPISRGGIARRFELINRGSDIEITYALCGGARIVGGAEILRSSGLKKHADGKFVTDGKTPVVAAASGYAAYGFGMIYGGGYVVETDGESIGLALDFSDEPYALCGGKTFCSPETFMMYSDRGVGGLARAVHDVIRELLMPEKYAVRRRPIYIVDGTAKPYDAAGLREKTAASSRLGVDTFMLDVKSEIDEKVRDGISAAKVYATDVGLKLGIGLPIERCFDNSLKAAAELGANVILLTAKNKGASAKQVFDRCVRAYSALGEVCAEYADLTVLCDGECDLGMGAYCMTVGAKPADRTEFEPFPPCMLTSRVEWTPRDVMLKSKFDRATFGALSYAFDPLAVDGNTANAFRAQIYSYQDDAELIAAGDMYGSGNVDTVVSKDKSKAYSVCSGAGKTGLKRVKFDGLDAHNLYHVRETDKTFSGAALVGYGIPLPAGAGENVSFAFHIRQVADFE